MKRRVSVMSALLVLLSVAFASAQSKQDGKYVFVISKVNYLKAIEDAVSQSKSEGLALSEARVILCGESVKALVEENPIIKKALQNPNIKVYACGLSLEQMNVDSKSLPKEVATVRNGILEAMKLERDGYKKFDL
jgi:intracellular sulfur oxidation DsrE/DsrF family protein